MSTVAARLGLRFDAVSVPASTTRSTIHRRRPAPISASPSTTSMSPPPLRASPSRAGRCWTPSSSDPEDPVGHGQNRRGCTRSTTSCTSHAVALVQDRHELRPRRSTRQRRSAGGSPSSSGQEQRAEQPPARNTPPLPGALPAPTFAGRVVRAVRAASRGAPRTVARTGGWPAAAGALAPGIGRCRTRCSRDAMRTGAPCRSWTTWCSYESFAGNGMLDNPEAIFRTCSTRTWRTWSTSGCSTT